MSHIYPPKGLLAQKAKFLSAVAKGDADEAERLLTQLKLTGRGDPSKVPNEDGLYPIHLAAAVGSESVCRLLVRHGANVNQLTETVGEARECRSCLHYAAMAGIARTIKFLIGAGADPHAKDLFGKKPYALCRDKASLRYLNIAMESWNNVLISGDLLIKACMAQLLVLDQPSINISSPHPRRLTTTYDTWFHELEHIRKANGVHIPKPTPPKPSFLRLSKNNMKLGQFIIVDKRPETGTMNCFSGIVHAKTIEYLGELSIEVEALYVRKDNRRQRMGTLLMYNLLSVFARKQFSHAIASIADSNHVAQTFFRKMGFKSLLPDAVPQKHKKNLHTFFEVQYMGLNLAKIEHYLDHYKDVKIIDDDDHMEEENQRVREARQRRIDDKNNAKREARSSEHGALYKQLENALGVNGDKAQAIEMGLGEEVGWWMKDPPVPQFYNGTPLWC
jgi:N-acetylglutamate synthase-like GNAT family acetyltransferase